MRVLADKHKARGEVPFATFDGSEHDKYPQHFSLRRKGADGADKVRTRGPPPVAPAAQRAVRNGHTRAWCSMRARGVLVKAYVAIVTPRT